MKTHTRLPPNLAWQPNGQPVKHCVSLSASAIAAKAVIEFNASCASYTVWRNETLFAHKYIPTVAGAYTVIVPGGDIKVQACAASGQYIRVTLKRITSFHIVPELNRAVIHLKADENMTIMFLVDGKIYHHPAQYFNLIKNKYTTFTIPLPPGNHTIGVCIYPSFKPVIVISVHIPSAHGVVSHTEDTKPASSNNKKDNTGITSKQTRSTVSNIEKIKTINFVSIKSAESLTVFAVLLILLFLLLKNI